MDLQLELARQHIRAGEYAEARTILLQSDTPQAKEWLVKLEELQARQPAKKLADPPRPLYTHLSTPPAPPPIPPGGTLDLQRGEPISTSAPRFQGVILASIILQLLALVSVAGGILGSIAIATTRGSSLWEGFGFFVGTVTAAVVLYLIAAAAEMLVSIKHSQRRTAEYLWRLVNRQ